MLELLKLANLEDKSKLSYTLHIDYRHFNPCVVGLAIPENIHVHIHLDTYRA